MWAYTKIWQVSATSAAHFRARQEDQLATRQKESRSRPFDRLFETSDFLVAGKLLVRMKSILSLPVALGLTASTSRECNSYKILREDLVLQTDVFLAP